MDVIEFIDAARMRHDAHVAPSEVKVEELQSNRHNHELNRSTRFKKRKMDEMARLSNKMIGFGVPGVPVPPMVINRNLPHYIRGPPYFYYENVALTPKGVWSTISRFLYDIEPEFLDSQYFCAAQRKRGYIHNLPTNNRFRLLPIPPTTIQEAFPLSRPWWPAWDTRTKLNCLVTCVGSAPLTERIKIAVEKSAENEEPPSHIKKYVMNLCKKWNLVWVGKNRVAPLDPSEMELIMGFPENHTRGGGIGNTKRYKLLGNSFQVDTVAYHLLVLKNLFLGGINVLSLFTGIGGAEVALHRLGIPLKNVVSVEMSKTCRIVVQSWWEETNQKGKLIHVPDVREVTEHILKKWISEFGGFDIVIGGSPCNNLAGGNRVSRDGLEGQHSSLFYEYYRILQSVRHLMRAS
ncbi:DNA (cytosine-5)-methyltransferase DRM2-like [Olea europaea var. sylvestris]|uniref:DNA (cytosine-5)-methyltransferase DRM2-like n=1 Tax=Olea europaea var. sylvestris TaxID=158386 RepID=UPI000C1D1FFA|nr:DNA (cytosine-5)-methyltransferase DRM2-like [Olea europaea var. sylvestris]